VSNSDASLRQQYDHDAPIFATTPTHVDWAKDNCVFVWWLQLDKIRISLPPSMLTNDNNVNNNKFIWGFVNLHNNFGTDLRNNSIRQFKYTGQYYHRNELNAFSKPKTKRTVSDWMMTTNAAWRADRELEKLTIYPLKENDYNQTSITKSKHEKQYPIVVECAAQ
jgi:hypothetical protein